MAKTYYSPTSGQPLVPLENDLFLDQLTNEKFSLEHLKEVKADKPVNTETATVAEPGKNFANDPRGDASSSEIVGGNTNPQPKTEDDVEDEGEGTGSQS